MIYNITMRKRVLLGFILIATFSFAGCATTPKAVPAKKIINRCDMPQWMAKQLDQTPIINVGQTITLVVPSNQLFLPKTGNMLQQARSTLYAVACVLKYYKKVVVKINGYTNYYSSGKYNRALSRLQAGKVAEYLWQHGIDTRLISAAGMGAADPIASDATASGREQNRRIEIEFQYY